MTVGRSSRTPFKHWILDSELGRLAGVFGSGGWRKTPARAPVYILDMCAGDGLTTDDHTSSLSVINKHGNHIAAKCQDAACVSHNGGPKVFSCFIEKDSATFEQLRDNADSLTWDASHDRTLIHDDAGNVNFVGGIHRKSQVIINVDPNTVNDIPLDESMLRQTTDTTMIIMTLGCNVGGLKRMPREKREPWFRRLAAIVNLMPSFHDAILVELVGDASQWAYLVRVPRKWSAKTAARIEKKGNASFIHGVSVASFRNDPAGYDAIVRRLFLQKKEIANGY